MARHTSSSVAHETRAPITPSHDATPANDAEAPARVDQPLRVLTTDGRKHLLAQVIAMPAPSAKRLPSYARERLDWMGEVHSTAWIEREVIARTHLRGRVVTVAELDDLGDRILFAREALDYAVVSSVRSAALAQTLGIAPSRMSDVALRGGMRDCRTALCDALKRHVPKGTKAYSEVLRIRRDRHANAHADNNRVLIAIFDDPKLITWLRALPRNEGSTFDRLTVLHLEWLRRAEARDGDLDENGVPYDFAERAFAFATAPMAAVLNVGRYLIEGDAARKGDYRGFRAPRHPKKPAKIVVEAPPVATEPAANPTNAQRAPTG